MSTKPPPSPLPSLLLPPSTNDHCTTNNQCIGGIGHPDTIGIPTSFCDKTGKNDCRPLSDYGENCAQTSDCLANKDLYCVYKKCYDGRPDSKCDATSQCKEQTAGSGIRLCGKPNGSGVAVHETCHNGRENAYCTSNSHCQASYVCNTQRGLNPNRCETKVMLTHGDSGCNHLTKFCPSGITWNCISNKCVDGRWGDGCSKDSQCKGYNTKKRCSNLGKCIDGRKGDGCSKKSQCNSNKCTFGTCK